MKLSGQAVAVLVIAVASGLIFRSLFPKRIETVGPPRIVTRHDTTRILDTLWRVRWRETVRWDTLPPEVITITAKPETVYVGAPPLLGLSVLSVPAKVGDSTVAEGFRVTASDSGYIRSDWRIQWWTPGPLKALSLDSFPPRVAFWPAVKVEKGCGFLCKVSHYGLGAAMGRASCAIK
jgi:hypothetical protein